MKLPISLIALLFCGFTFQTFSAFAEDSINQLSFDHCNPQRRPDPGNSIVCAEKAYAGPFTKEESIHLCEGARGIEPATCAEKAYSGAFSKAEAIDLCQRASSNAPAECANKAYSGPFSRKQSVQLCSRKGDLAIAECAIKAYSGPYSKEEAIRICKSNGRLLLRSLNILSKALDLKEGHSINENKFKIKSLMSKTLEIK